jgi:phosphoribosylformylglycinamidine cyclo-ligase
VAGLRGTLGQVLLAPHRSYCALVHPLLRDIVALAHITGGGFESNIGRLLPVETSCVIRKAAWQPSRLFRLIQEAAEAPDDEMYRTFNMGIGMVLFVRPAVAHRVAGRLRGARIIGQLVRGTFGVAVV